MNTILKELTRVAKKLKRKGILNLDTGIDMKAEVNLQVIITIIEDLNLMMGEKKYEMFKGDKEKLLDEIVVSSIRKDNLINRFDDEFKKGIIKKYIYLDDPELIWGTYCFITNDKKLQELDQKALKQIDEGKFKNYIFG